MVGCEGEQWCLSKLSCSLLLFSPSPLTASSIKDLEVFTLDIVALFTMFDTQQEFGQSTFQKFLLFFTPFMICGVGFFFCFFIFRPCSLGVVLLLLSSSSLLFLLPPPPSELEKRRKSCLVCVEASLYPWSFLLPPFVPSTTSESSFLKDFVQYLRCRTTIALYNNIMFFSVLVLKLIINVVYPIDCSWTLGCF